MIGLIYALIACFITCYCFNELYSNRHVIHSELTRKEYLKILFTQEQDVLMLLIVFGLIWPITIACIIVSNNKN